MLYDGDSFGYEEYSRAIITGDLGRGMRFYCRTQESMRSLISRISEIDLAQELIITPTEEERVLIIRLAS